jgi:hypothetical protein
MSLTLVREWTPMALQKSEALPGEIRENSSWRKWKRVPPRLWPGFEVAHHLDEDAQLDALWGGVGLREFPAEDLRCSGEEGLSILVDRRDGWFYTIGRR